MMNRFQTLLSSSILDMCPCDLVLMWEHGLTTMMRVHKQDTPEGLVELLARAYNRSPFTAQLSDCSCLVPALSMEAHLKILERPVS